MINRAEHHHELDYSWLLIFALKSGKEKQTFFFFTFFEIWDGPRLVEVMVMFSPAELSFFSYVQFFTSNDYPILPSYFDFAHTGWLCQPVLYFPWLCTGMDFTPVTIFPFSYIIVSCFAYSDWSSLLAAFRLSDWLDGAINLSVESLYSFQSAACWCVGVVTCTVILAIYIAHMHEWLVEVLGFATQTSWLSSHAAICGCMTATTFNS